MAEALARGKRVWARDRRGMVEDVRNQEMWSVTDEWGGRSLPAGGLCAQSIRGSGGNLPLYRFETGS